MSDQEEGHGHHVTTMHAVRHLFERIPAEQLLGQTPQQFFDKLDAAQNKQDGMPGGNFPPLQFAYKAVHKALGGSWNERIVAGDGTTALPSKLAPGVQKAHALSNPNLNSHENLAAIKSQLVNQLEAAWGAHIEGNKAAEFEHLGKVAHLVVDSFSGGHMLRDPSRPGDPEAPIKALLNFSKGLWPGSNTHTDDLDKVPTVASNNDLARSADQAGAEALGRMLAVFVQNVDSREPAATHKAFTEIVEKFFQADNLVTFNDKNDPAFQQMLAEHYANEVSQLPVVPDSPEQNISTGPSAAHPGNISVDPSVAHPETSSMDPATATGSDAVTMPPPDAGPASQGADHPQASFPEDAPAATAESHDHPQAPASNHGASASLQSAPEDGAAANQSVPPESGPAQVQSHEPALASYPEAGPPAAPPSPPNQSIDPSHAAAASPPNQSIDPGHAAAAPAASTHDAAAAPATPDAGHSGPVQHSDTAGPNSSPPHEAVANASQAPGDHVMAPAAQAAAPDQGGIMHPTGGVQTDVKRVTDEHGHRDYIYGHGGSTGQTAHEHAANPHQPHNWQSQNGADIICPPGTPIYAAFDGRIGDKFGVERGHENDGPQSNHHGNRLTIEGATNQAYYQHLDRFADGIAPGATVHQGQLIGYSGTGGGIHHLHFALQHGDTDQLLHDAAAAHSHPTAPDHHGPQGSPDAPSPPADHATAPAVDHALAQPPGHVHSADATAHNGRFPTAQEFRYAAEHQGVVYHPELLHPHPSASDLHIGAVVDPSTHHLGQDSHNDAVAVDPSSAAGHGATAAAGDDHTAATVDPSHHHDPASGHHASAAGAADTSHHQPGGHHGGHHQSPDGSVAIDPSAAGHGGAGHHSGDSAAAADPSSYHPTGHHQEPAHGGVAVDPSSGAEHGAHAGGGAHSGVVIDPSAGDHSAAAASDPSHHGGAVAVDPSSGAGHGHHDAAAAGHDHSSHAAAAPAHHAAPAAPAHHDAAGAAHHGDAAAGHH